MTSIKGISAFLRRQASRLVADCKGNTAILFALTLIPMLGAVGVALDYSRANSLRGKLQAAADAAALAAGKEQDGTEAARKLIAEEVFSANAAQLKFTNEYTLAYADIDDGAAARVDVTAQVPTTVSGILGINEIGVHVRAETGLSGGTMEIALVVDNSGSMDGSRIASLKTAARDLVKTLYGSQNFHPTIQIGIVPFAATVNVGAQYKNASWMDTNGVSSIHYNNMDSEDYTRFELYDELKNISWEGCVEARPYPLDVQDTAPSAGTPDSYFVPLFAPDEPGNKGVYDYSKYYYNSYLDDDEGDCEDSGSGSSRRPPARSRSRGHFSGGHGHGYGYGYGGGGGGGGGSSSSLTDEEKQKRVCKYMNENAKSGTNSVGTRWGPNFLCDSSAITPLTNSKGDLNSAIGKLGSYGGTNLHEGLMWGWRVLSPGVPFTEGKAYDDDENRKIIVLMSDGANFHGTFPNFNKSWYSAYGYAAENRLGNNLNSTNQLVSAMNSRTLEACTNAKAAGILIYTIAFDISDNATVQLLQSCASSASMAYNTNSTSQMVAAFEDIAKKLGELRLAR